MLTDLRYALKQLAVARRAHDLRQGAQCSDAMERCIEQAIADELDELDLDGPDGLTAAEHAAVHPFEWLAADEWTADEILRREG